MAIIGKLAMTKHQMRHLTYRTLPLVSVLALGLGTTVFCVASLQPAAASTSSKIWIGRYAEFEDFLRTAEIVESKTVAIGVTAPQHVFFRPGGLAAGGALKAIEPGILGGYWDS